MIQTSESIIKIIPALKEVQKALKPLKKDKDNPYFNSKYADLEQCWESVRKDLAKNDLILTQFPSELGLCTMLAHTSGEFLACDAKLPETNNPQKSGSAITYFRRYALTSILGMVAEDEDDDGNKAAKSDKKSPKKPPKEVSEKPNSDPAESEKAETSDLMKKIRVKCKEVGVTKDELTAWIVKFKAKDGDGSLTFVKLFTKYKKEVKEALETENAKEMIQTLLPF